MNWSIGFEPLLSWTWLAAILVPLGLLAIAGVVLAQRGSLFDVLEANDAYFATAVAYVQAISELDAARYVLLSRTGRLLEALDIAPAPIAGAD